MGRDDEGPLSDRGRTFAFMSAGKRRWERPPLAGWPKLKRIRSTRYWQEIKEAIIGLPCTGRGCSKVTWQWLSKFKSAWPLLQHGDSWKHKEKGSFKPQLSRAIKQTRSVCANVISMWLGQQEQLRTKDSSVQCHTKEKLSVHLHTHVNIQRADRKMYFKRCYGYFWGGSSGI